MEGDVNDIPDSITIIGLCGGMRSGKTSIANLFLKNHSLCRRISFANGVRAQVARGMGLHQSVLGGMDKQKLRPILQSWGTGMREIHGADYWVNLLIQDNFWQQIPSDAVVFIDDVRFVNEASMIIESGGYLIRLDCDEQTKIERGANPDPANLKHSSEVALDGFSSYLTTIDTSSLLPHETFAQIYSILRAKGVFVYD